MKHYLIVITVFACACKTVSKLSETPFTNKEIINSEGDTMLIGRCNISIFDTGAAATWYHKGFSEYQPKQSTVDSLRARIHVKQIEIFLGSWCGDSRLEVPRFMKVISTAGFDTSAIRLVFVDAALSAYKQSPTHEEKGKFIHHIPTFIIYDGKKEIGRIVESPVKSLEGDLLNIVERRPVTTKYKAAEYWNEQLVTTKLLDESKLNSYALELKPLVLHVGELNAVGYMYAAAKEWNKGINVLKLNAKLFPDKHHAFAALGETYRMMNDKIKAIQFFEKALAINPSHAFSKQRLSSLQ